MHQYGAGGLCLLWAVNNALGEEVLRTGPIMRAIGKIDHEDKTRNARYFVGKDGIDFKTFKKVIRNDYGIELKKVKHTSKMGRYLLTYDFGDYLHTIAMRKGEVLDSRKRQEIKQFDAEQPLVDIYKLQTRQI
jgi:hypothetical protein